MMENCTPILYGSSKVLSYYKKMVDCPNLAFTNIRNCEQAETSKLNVLNIIQDEVKIEVGQATEIAGQLAALSLDLAAEDLMQGKFDAIVTNPINKNVNNFFPWYRILKFGQRINDYGCDKLSWSSNQPCSDVPSVTEELKQNSTNH